MNASGVRGPESADGNHRGGGGLGKQNVKRGNSLPGGARGREGERAEVSSGGGSGESVEKDHEREKEEAGAAQRLKGPSIRSSANFRSATNIGKEEKITEGESTAQDFTRGGHQTQEDSQREYARIGLG